MVREVRQLREMSEAELLERLDQLKAELRKIRSEIGTGGGVGKPARAREIRRSIARALTVLRERRRNVQGG